eukprot:361505-Chlamydomonas_euryale.AAC.4
MGMTLSGVERGLGLALDMGMTLPGVERGLGHLLGHAQGHARVSTSVHSKPMQDCPGFRFRVHALYLPTQRMHSAIVLLHGPQAATRSLRNGRTPRAANYARAILQWVLVLALHSRLNSV